MRCKRCGELLEPADTRCPVCGKTVTPPRRRAPAQKPAETNIKLPQLDRFAHAYSRDAARSRMLQMATIGAVIAGLLLTVMAFAGISDVKQGLKDLQITADAQLQAMQNQPAGTPDTGYQEQTDPVRDETGDETEPNTEGSTQTSDEELSVPLAQQRFKAGLTLYNTADGAYAAASANIDGIDAWVSTIRTGGERKTRVAWILKESGERVDLYLSESYGEDPLAAMTLSWDADGAIFGDMGSPVCLWEYQVGGSTWESLPTEYLKAIAGGCELKISAENMDLLLAQYTRMEIRCRVSMSHPAGGSVEILVDGLMLDENGLAVSGGLLN